MEKGLVTAGCQDGLQGTCKRKGFLNGCTDVGAEQINWWLMAFQGFICNRNNWVGSGHMVHNSGRTRNGVALTAPTNHRVPSSWSGVHLIKHYTTHWRQQYLWAPARWHCQVNKLTNSKCLQCRSGTVWRGSSPCSLCLQRVHQKAILNTVLPVSKTPEIESATKETKWQKAYYGFTVQLVSSSLRHVLSEQPNALVH